MMPRSTGTPSPLQPLVFAAALAMLSPGPAQERVAFAARDGHPIAGTLMKPSGAPKGGVVALPTAKSQRLAFDPLLPRLAQAGLLTLVIEPRYGSREVERPESGPAELSSALLDLEAALEQLVANGAPVDKLAVVGAGTGATLALDHARRTGVRIKALVLLSPGRDDPVPTGEALQETGGRPILILATSDEADRGANALKEALPSAEVQLHEDRLAFGTGMFGRVKGVESTIADWIDRMLAMPAIIEIGHSSLVLIDGEMTPSEAPGAATIKMPLGGGADALIRLTHNGKRLDVGFDIPEPYVRLNEVVIYIDGSGAGGRLVGDACYRISFNPKNPARKPLMVQRGGLTGFVDSDEKGVIAFARTPQKERHWSAEVSLDLSRFLRGDPPRSARMGFQINGQRMSDVRYYPDDAKLPTAPGTWVGVRLK